MNRSFIVFAFALLAACALAAPAADRVTKLPLIDEEIVGQYSGYLSVGELQFHYWLVEAETNAASSPIVFWLNGGPGCSSLDGYWYEHGPYHFSQDDKDLKVIKNPYSWNKIANIVYLETPPGVGFSFSNAPLNATYNDPAVAKINYQAVDAFFKKFPEYKGNDLWVTGESYAGVYVPLLADQIVKNGVYTLNGVMVGNGVTNADGSSPLQAMSFLHGHGIINDITYEKILTTCQHPNNPGQECAALLNYSYNQMDDIDMYDIYSDCYHQRGNGGNGIPCVSSFFGHEYLNMPAVKKAIHVKEDLTWTICNMEINENYARTSQSMVPVYKRLLKNRVNVLIYSGDVDFSVPYTGTQFWVYHDMGLAPYNQRDWTQWYFNDQEGRQVAGFVSDFMNPSSAARFTFATVRGSGHIFCDVPEVH